MTDMISDVPNTENAENPKSGAGLDEQLINQPASRAKAGGLQLTGEGGVLQQLTAPCPRGSATG